MRRRNDSGFTLIEMMIVVEIISVLVALAFPALMRQRIQTNEAVAVENLRTICTAQISFNTVNLRYGAFEELTAGDGATPYLDGLWIQDVVRNEYTFSMMELTNDTFTAMAAPVTPGRSGIRTFSISESGEVRIEGGVGGPAAG